jgi:hypothetical protein
MMVKKLFKRFEQDIHSCALGASLVFGFLFITSCATASYPKSSGSHHSEVTVELSEQSIEPGSVALLRVQVPVSFKSSSVFGEFDGIQLPFFPAGENQPGVYETLLSIPYDKKQGSAVATVRVGEANDSSSLTIPIAFEIIEGHYLSEILQVDGSRVNPKSKKVIARILKEQSEVKRLYSTVTLTKFWKGPFRLPVLNGTITSPYGTKRVYNGELKSFHTGLDLKAAMKTPIHAAANGVILLAKDLFFSGNTVLIDHGYGVMTVYAHLSKLKVKKGQKVNLGQLIGLSGKTGRVNGPHLHWQTVVHQIKVNPLTLLKAVR